MTMHFPCQSDSLSQKENDWNQLNRQLPLWVIPKTAQGACPPPGLVEPKPAYTHSAQSDTDESFEPFLCLPSFMRQALQLPKDDIHPAIPQSCPPKMAVDSRAPPPDATIIPSPPGLEPDRALAKSPHDFKIIFTGYDQDKHADFELVPRLIGKRGCNMLPIKKMGADIRVCGRGSGYLEIHLANGQLIERNEVLQVAVSCRTLLSCMMFAAGGLDILRYIRYIPCNLGRRCEMLPWRRFWAF